jgi:hypothetical protein
VHGKSDDISQKAHLANYNKGAKYTIFELQSALNGLKSGHNDPRSTFALEMLGSLLPSRRKKKPPLAQIVSEEATHLAAFVKRMSLFT